MYYHIFHNSKHGLDGLKGTPDENKLILFSSSSKLVREGKGGVIWAMPQKIFEVFPQGNGRTFCNGDCQWWRQKCQPKQGRTLQMFQKVKSGGGPIF